MKNVDEKLQWEPSYFFLFFSHTSSWFARSPCISLVIAASRDASSNTARQNLVYLKNNNKNNDKKFEQDLLLVINKTTSSFPFQSQDEIVS
jgi:hypothetical protein